MKRSMYRKVKRFLDFILSLFLLILLSPLMIFVSLMIKIEEPRGSVLFKQIRPGKDTKLFTIYKFRTMKSETMYGDIRLSDKLRLTKVGKWLRKSSLDELPQLFNVLKGDLSLIGPRPLLVEYVPFYSPEENRRHQVRPGITGWAQVHGRNHLVWEERLEKDIEYVDHLSFLLDIHIVWLTIQKLLNHTDVADDTNEVEGNLAKIRAKNIHG